MNGTLPDSDVVGRIQDRLYEVPEEENGHPSSCRCEECDPDAGYDDWKDGRSL